MSGRGPWDERVFRLALRLYPKAFRDGYGPEILGTYRALRRAGRQRPARLLVSSLVDAAATAARVRLDAWRRSDATHGPRRLPARIRKDRERPMAHLVYQLRLAVRTLFRNPGFTAVTVLTLGLGIGATTAIFSVVRAVVLKPLPYEDAGDLVWLQNRYLPGGGTGGVSGAELWEYRETPGAFEGLAAVSPEAVNLTGLDEPLRIGGTRVSATYFPLLRVPFELGRGFTAEETAPGAPPVVVISYGLWQSVLGGSDVIGQTLQLDARPRTIVGVVAADHRPLAPYLFPGFSVEFWLPSIIDPASFDASSVELHNLSVLGRLESEVTPQAAERALRPAVARLEERYPGISNAGSRDVAVTSLQERVVGSMDATLGILLGAVSLLLVVACVNVANVLLARGESKIADTSVHAALGAGRRRLALQSLIESGLLGLAGGALGIVIAVAARRFLTALAPAALPRIDEIAVDPAVLAFCAVVSVAAGALAGLVPSIRLMREDPFQHLKAAGRSGGLGRGGGLRRILVVAQVAAAVVIASAAGLLGRTVLALRAVDPGFDPSNVLMVEVNAPRADYPNVAAVRDLYVQILESLEAVPGVESAAASWQTPLQVGMSDWPVRTNAEDAEWVGADPNLVTPAYFRTYGIELVSGRLFDRSDLARPDGAVILSETAARRLFPGESAVGRTVNVNFDAPVWREVVGVVRDIRGRGLGQDPRPQTYFTQSSVPFGAIATLTVAVRGRVTPGELREAASATLQRLDPDVPLGGVTALEDQVSRSVASERFLAILLGAFAGTALLLGCIGVYGVLAYDVSRRRREIGLRIALGARPGGVLAGVVRGALVLAGIGIGIGVAGALASGRLLEGWLYGVSSADPLHAITVGAVVLGAALLAGFLPARRAGAVSPLTALREE